MASLSKALHPNDSERLSSAQSYSGPGLIRHQDEIEPPAVAPHRQTLAAHLSKPEIAPEAGQMTHQSVQTKVIADTGAGRYLLRPYFESPETAPKPTSGWNEMTSQSLYHAGGIGHMHQQVHVARIQHGGSEEPAVAIHMAPGHQEIGQHQGPLSPEAHADIGKMAAMDFLTDNGDRHSQNIMMSPTGRPLAIDHGAAFQYDQGWSRDPSSVSEFMERIPKGEHGSAPSTMEWWKTAAPAVKQAFEERLKLVRHHALKEHLRQNFTRRHDHLTQAAAAGDQTAFWTGKVPSTLTPGWRTG